MRIFITGGTGFLGKYVVSELRKRGHRILLLSREAYPHRAGVTLLKGDIANPRRWKGRLKAFKPEAAILLAWEGIPSQDLDLNLRNLVGSLECIRAVGEAGCKTIVVTGSDQEYGHTGRKMKETDPTRPYNLLFSTKTALYWLGSKVAEQYKTNFIWSRIFFVYGPGQRSGALIPYLVNSLRNGEKPEIRNPYGANDFIYIEDVARALVLLATRKPKSANEIYNIGSGRLTPTIDIIRAVYSMFDYPVPRFSSTSERPPKWRGAYANIDKIKKDYNWKPTVGITEGVTTVVKNLLKNG